MTVLVLCNVGNSDLVVESVARGEPPRQVYPDLRRVVTAFLNKEVGFAELKAAAGVARDELPWQARPLAARLNAERETYWDRIRLPILTKALDYILAQGEPIKTIILFVSDQDRELAGEDEWIKDTCELGGLIKEKLLEQYKEHGWSSKQIRLHAIPGNPADYDTMLTYFEAGLPRIRSYYEPASLKVYLSLTGGTPAMNAMLLVVGNEVFGPQTVNLYDARERKQPFPLGVGRRLASRALRVAMLTNLQTYQYAAALALLQTEGPVLVDAHSTRRVLADLLTHARDRLAFNFADAAQTLDAALPHAAGPLKDRLLYWQNQILNPTETDRLRELYFSAEIKRLNHAYAGWLERVFRFQESALRHAAVNLGVAFRDKNLEYLDPDWLETQPGLVDYLAQAPRPDGGVGLDPCRSASRPLLQATLAFLAEQQDDDGLRRFVALSNRLEALATLRNHWVHRNQGVQLADVEKAFGDSLEAAAQTLTRMFQLLTDVELGPNPYDAINAQCRDLVEGGGQ
jgi:hypothetical protein